MGIEELAIAYWRLTKWVDNAEVDRKMAATSALRQIKKYLSYYGVEVLDYCGQKYDSGFAIDVVGRTTTKNINEEDLVIVETIRPIILQNGEIIKYGQAMLGEPIEQVDANGTPFVMTSSSLKLLSKQIDMYCTATNSDKLVSWILKKCNTRISKQICDHKENK